MTSHRVDKQLLTIEYIKKLTEQLGKEAVSESKDDSLVISDSQTSGYTVKLPIKPQREKQVEKYAKKYVSPYKQDNISIDKIQKTGRPRLNPKINFSNVFIQLATSREKDISRNNSQASRYRTNSSMFQKLELSALDNLRLQAKEMHERQERQRIEMTPRQRNEKWADFLLRQRKWEQERRIREMQNKQEILLKQRKSDQYLKTQPKEVPGLSRQNIIRKIKRERMKLEGQLDEISSRPYKWKEINIRGQKNHTPPKHILGKVIIADPKQASFLVELP